METPKEGSLAAILDGSRDEAGREERNDAPRLREASRSRQILREAIDDAFVILSYAVDGGVQLDAEVLERIIAADAAERAGTITQEQERNFWLAATAASKAILPVTPDSLRCAIVEGHESAADRAARKYRLRTLITLFALLVFQVYWLVGATLTADIDAIKGRLSQLATDYTAADHAIAQANPKSPTFAADLKDAQARMASVNDRIWVERISIATDFAVLRNWNVFNRVLLLAWSPFKPLDQSPSSTTSFIPVNAASRFLWEFTPETVSQVQTARIALTTLLQYILPILYGALGASAFIVRTLAAEIKAITYTSESNVGYLLRFYLGAVAGLSIAWFTSGPKVPETTGLLPSLSPLALAFVAGFSVELLFSLLERVVAAFSVEQRAAAQK